MIPEEVALHIREIILDFAHDDIHAEYRRIPSHNDFMEQVAPLIRAAVEAEREANCATLCPYCAHPDDWFVACYQPSLPNGPSFWHHLPRPDYKTEWEAIECRAANIRARAQIIE